MADKDDVKFRKAETNTDTSANGGRKSQVIVLSGVMHALMPRVTAAQRKAGLERQRKQFMCNDNVDDDVMYNPFLWLEAPSNADDMFYLGLGTQDDTEGDLEDYNPIKVGAGQLNTALNGGETQVELIMEDGDFQFPNGGYLHISDKFDIRAEVAANVRPGDSVQYNDGTSTWLKIAATTDIEYPKGIYMDLGIVMTLRGTSNEEWLEIVDNLYEDEVIGAGNGWNVSPTISALDHATNGICRQPGKLPVVTAELTEDTLTVLVAADGSCSGDCSAGQLNMATGAWTTPITWTTAPKNNTNITITYRENCFKYTGNVATIDLADQVANPYSSDVTYGAGCITMEQIEPTSEDFAVTSARGTFDINTYPLVLHNKGTEEDEFTITFTSATAFNVTGVKCGSIATGSITNDLAPTNEDAGNSYFELNHLGFGGTFAQGDTIQFKTHPATFPHWFFEKVPENTAQKANNIIVLGFSFE